MAVYYNEEFELISRAEHHDIKIMPNMHYHSKNELYYLESGNVTYFINDKIYNVQSGEFIFIPKHVFHKTSYPESQPVSRLVLSFDSTFLGFEYPEYAKMLSELKKYKHIQVEKSKRYFFEEILRNIEFEDKHRKNDYIEAERSYLKLLIIFMLRYHIKESSSKKINTQIMIQDTIDYITQHYSDELTLEFFAEKYSMSPGHFSKLFKQVSGVNLLEYINIARIVAAEKLLLNTDMSIDKISKKCGFNSSSYFAQVFKRLKGISPKKYSQKTE